MLERGVVGGTRAKAVYRDITDAIPVTSQRDSFIATGLLSSLRDKSPQHLHEYAKQVKVFRVNRDVASSR
jgi:hypothetical protein